MLVFFNAQIFRPADSDKISNLADLAHHPKSFEDRWFIGLISKFAQTRLKHRERKTGRERENTKMKQIYLRQYNVALSLIAAIVS